MESLITRIEEGDPDLTTLALTSECESVEQLNRLLHALQQKHHCVESVVYRESFFPLRRIREHLPRADIVRMLEQVSQYATHTLQLPPTMMGMVRGPLASLTVGTQVQHYHADEAITFGSDADVWAMAERFRECTQLTTLDLEDCYVLRSRAPSLDPILQVIAEKDTLQLLHLSCHPEQQIKQPLLTTHGLETLLLSTSFSLETLNLSRLGLEDEHFGILAQALLTSTVGTTLQWLCLDGNRPSRAGIQAFANALSSEDTTPTLRGLSLLETWHTSNADWSRLFPGNAFLQHLELDHKSNNQTDMESWLILNRQGRADWIREGSMLPLNLWPLVLEPLSESPATIWYILQFFCESLLLR